MLDRDTIRALIPHQGTMCLLDQAYRWSATHIEAGSNSHLDRDNPLRHNGRLATICGSEYALQAAVLHGALLAGHSAQRPGRLAALRLERIHAERLDDPALGRLLIEAHREWSDRSGLIYCFTVADARRVLLLQGRATIVLPKSSS